MPLGGGGVGGGGVIEGVTKFTPLCVQVRESS